MRDTAADIGRQGNDSGRNFSQIATVLQSGGEEGMWTYERYQRWMDQVTDWVRPPTATALRGAGRRGPGSSGTGAPGREAARRQGDAERGSAEPERARKHVDCFAAFSGARRPRPAPAAKPPSEDVIEVPAEEMDLAALAELAKKVVERKP